MAPLIFSIGESVLDIIFSEGKPINATPGGSMLNSVISLARTGCEVQFISEYGNDQPGDIIHQFLALNKVGTQYISRYNDGKTALALAFLDKDRNASYSFHSSYPKIRMKYPLPGTKQGDVILFGSIYSITDGIHGKILKWISKAHSAGSLVIYDPNFRKSHQGMLEKVRPRICRNIAAADIVRGSDEDFQTIFGLNDPDEIRTRIVALGCKNLIITRNYKSVIAWFGDLKVMVEIPPLEPVSTIGAGDSFNAGIIYALVRAGMNEAGTSFTKGGISEFRTLIGTGIDFASEVCKSSENYVSAGFVKKLVQ